LHQKTIELLEFQTIKTMLADYTYSNLGRKMIDKLTANCHLSAVMQMLQETTEARLILDTAGTPPMYGLADIEELLSKTKAGGILDPVSLQAIADFLRGCRKTREFMEKRLELAPLVARYALGITPLPGLEEEINRCIVDSMVANDASSNLKKIRKEIARIQEKIKTKLQQILLSPEAKLWLQEPIISIRESRQVLMVKANYKNKLPGIVLGSSNSGGTLFMEPLAVHQLSNELKTLEGAEQEEIYQILSGLSGAVGAVALEIEKNTEIMSQYDLAFAKARLSRAMHAIAPVVNERGFINIKGGCHPLLTEKPIPLDFYIGETGHSGYNYRTLVITGPNTGGKTVALKTIGLLTLMTQTGLHIPAESGTEIAVFREILADIGDGQNISQSLSTFSAHISNIIGILGKCSRDSLVLIDEVGTGTDPAEGSALAIAILEYLYAKGAVTIASTHYPEIKTYALSTPGFRNGSMAFDRENLQPLYRLIIGQPGESNALWIAEKLGLPMEVLENAKKHLPGERTELPALQPLNMNSPHNDYSAEKFATLPVPATPEAKDNQPVKSPVNSETPSLAPTPAPEKIKVKVGDLVTVPYLNEKGVICSEPDTKGRIRVLIKGKKMELPVKRIQLLIPGEELYPENYDLNIVTLSKEERKLKHQFEKKHVAGIERVVSEDEL
jgi:DNA mismatch repair protein MutS2